VILLDQAVSQPPAHPLPAATKTAAGLGGCVFREAPSEALDMHSVSVRDFGSPGAPSEIPPPAK
jgi:hypothetical protein